MNRSRRRFDPPSRPTCSGPTGSGPTGSKPNRLSRSFRQTQQTEVEPPKSQQSEFKTPTRIQRPRAGGGFSGESPNNDSDFQQDIIWDATSPSPNRLGKRGKKQPAGVVNISEIVSRIAPKHGRPRVAEPTLQQWIGDSATIPCTPDVQVPKPKKRSPRPNGVDDLLKLAKQFDFNMFHQDEEEDEDVDDLHQQSLELLSGDVLDLEDGFPPSLPGDCRPAAGGDERVHPDQHMEDDLDFLFDGPTQHVSGNLSQVSSAQPSQTKPPSGAHSGKPSSSHASSSSSGVCTTNAKGTLGNDEFEDDWENDDLLNDSLVLEMTQNPQRFTAPKHCSTQKPSRETKPPRGSPAHAAAAAGVGLGQSAASKVETDNVRQRTSFRLESNSDFSVRGLKTDVKVDQSSGGNTQQSRFSSRASVDPGPQRTWRTSWRTSGPQEPQFDQRTSAASNTSASKPAQTETPAGPELLDEDLDSLFSSEPVWDDPADDDLLCELCEDVENQIQSAENVSTRPAPPAGHMTNQRAALQPASRTRDNWTRPANQEPFPKKPAAAAAAPPRASGRPAVSSLAAGSHVSAVTGPIRFTQAKNASASTNSSAYVQQSSRVQSAPQVRKDHFTFKRPNVPVSTATSTVVGKCSAAEIELKKQQAMERRRQRLQAAQNLRAPT